MRKVALFLFLVMTGTGATAQFKNIKLAEQEKDGPPMVEPSIVVNQKDEKNIIDAKQVK